MSPTCQFPPCPVAFCSQHSARPTFPPQVRGGHGAGEGSRAHEEPGRGPGHSPGVVPPDTLSQALFLDKGVIRCYYLKNGTFQGGLTLDSHGDVVQPGGRALPSRSPERPWGWGGVGWGLMARMDGRVALRHRCARGHHALPQQRWQSWSVSTKSHSPAFAMQTAKSF